MVGRADAERFANNLAIPTMTRTPCAGLLEGYSKRAKCEQQRHSTRILEDEEPRDDKR
ncbi:MAG TPA: hypothetical protein VEX37_00240 [Thermomicrobiales bacterium]|nr:hypothetical protein [Thermomicrobiales bacterium]